jgi:hypothetical protein
MGNGGRAMISDPMARPSRRALLSAALGGLAGLVAASLGRPQAVRAGSDGDVVLGASNGSTTSTEIQTPGSQSALIATTTGGNSAAIVADSAGGPGVLSAGHGPAAGLMGQSYSSGPGVFGVIGPNSYFAPLHTGVYGYGAQGVVGQADPSPGSVGYVGVQGFAGVTNPPPATAPQTQKAPAGVYGEASGADPTGVWGDGGTASSGSTTGVYGEGDTGVWGYGGWGVFGASDATGTGVYGFSGATVPAAPAHVGVFGYTDSGYAIYARAATGTALYVDGKARFRRSGRTSVPAGHSLVKVTLAGVTTSSWIIATPQTNRAGVFVQAVVPASGSFTIYLNKVVSGTTYVGYLVIN